MTVVPAFTVIVPGVNMKPLAEHLDGLLIGRTGVCREERAEQRRGAISSGRSYERPVRERQRERMLRQRDAAGAEHAGQLIGGNLERPGPLPHAGRGLRIGGRARGVEGHVALDFLHDLMDVAVQHGDRAEAAQIRHELRRIARAPTPRLVNGPQRHVREHDDRRARGAAFEIGLDPRELIGAQACRGRRA